VVGALPLLGAFVLGLGVRRWLQRHFALLFRTQIVLGMGVVAVLAGWSFELSLRNVGALGVLLVAQVTAVLVAARLFRARPDGPLLAFGMYGNPTFWSLPVAAATLGPHAGVFIVAYDMLTQGRIALGVKLLRMRAPIAQSGRSALADYAPTAGALAGVLLGRIVAAPPALATVVTVLGVAMAVIASVLLGVAWPREWLGRSEARLSLRGLALHLTLVPSVLGAAFGPLPVSVVSFAKLYGYSTRTAATGLALSVGLAVALLPLALRLGA
jgi:predicted permease